MNFLNLPEVVDAAAVDSLQAHLLEQMRRDNSCRLDGSSVERIGTVGLQVLWSAQLSFAARGLEFDVSPRSPALSHALAMAGLDGPEYFNFTREPQ